MNNYSFYNDKNYYPLNGSQNFDNNDRIIGAGFAFPFLLGGVTGAALAPAFARPGFGYYRPYYPPFPPYPAYPPYRPYFR